MDLSRGKCILCKHNTKIVVPPQSEDTTLLLKDILTGHMDCKKFDEINSSLKVCPLCIYDLITIANYKKHIKGELSKNCDNCVLCYSETHLVNITDWTHFDKILQTVTSEKKLEDCFACVNCIKILDIMTRIKTNLFEKYPNLELPNASKDSRLRESSPIMNNRPSTYKKMPRGLSTFILDEETEYLPKTKIDNLKAALQHLKPLENTRFKIDKFKQDNKLLKQIAFVKLTASNLSSKNYKKLYGRPKSPERSRRSINFSDTDSSEDTPSTKKSFFKIRLQINPSKTKSRRVLHGKVAKPSATKKYFLENKKELVVKILNMNFDKLAGLEYKNIEEIRTPTKASRKMLPEDPNSSSKKRKSVTFADVLDTEIPESLDRKDSADATPLKSLLKKNVSFKSGLWDDSDSDDPKIMNNIEPTSDSDEELQASKGDVDSIVENIDAIFNNLQEHENTEVMSAKNKELRRSFSNESNSDGEAEKEREISSSDLKTKKNGIQEENMEELKLKKSKNCKIRECDFGAEEGIAEREENTSSENEKQEENGTSTELRTNKRKRIKDHNDSDASESENDIEKSKIIDTEFKENKKQKGIITSDVEETESRAKEEGDIGHVAEGINISNIPKDKEINIDTTDEKDNTSELKNKQDEKTESMKNNRKHKRTKLNSTSDSEDNNINKEATENLSDNECSENNQKNKKTKRNLNVDSNSEDYSANKGSEENLSDNEFLKNNQQHKKTKRLNSTSSSESEDTIADKENKEKNLDNQEQRSTGSGESIRSSVEGDMGSDKIKEPNNGRDNPIENSSSNDKINRAEITKHIDNQDKTEENADNEVAVNENEKEERQSDKHISDSESESEKNTLVLSSDSDDSSNLRSKPKRQSKYTIERQAQEALNITSEEDNEEPETKREKVSEVHDMTSDTDSKKDINASEATNIDMPLEVPEKQKDVCRVDIDELLTKYVNPSIPNLNIDNVSDSQNAEATSEV